MDIGTIPKAMAIAIYANNELIAAGDFDITLSSTGTIGDTQSIGLTLDPIMPQITQAPREIADDLDTTDPAED